MGNIYNAREIANFLIYLMSETSGDITNMKLNKLLYYAQGHYLQQYSRPLFSDPIFAWQHGPVVRSVYEAYKQYGGKPIDIYDASMIDIIDDKTKAYLVDIARVYGRYTASALRNMTHKPKSPWALTFDGGVIDTQCIKDYFDNDEDTIKPVEPKFTQSDFIGRRDENGVLVLPEDWNDATV